jgi:hypothetical protein
MSVKKWNLVKQKFQVQLTLVIQNESFNTIINSSFKFKIGKFRIDIEKAND